MEGDPNSVESMGHIPGSTFLGALAASYRTRMGLANPGQDEQFLRLFLGKGIQFLNAYPAAVDRPDERLIPVPHSVRESKESGEIFDLTGHAQEKPLRRLGGVFMRIDPAPAFQGVAMGLEYHHARAADRRFGRALGSEVPDGDSFFSYAPLRSGQVFIGALLGSPEDLGSLKGAVSDGTVCRLGRSRTARYGAARLNWMDPDPKRLEELGPEWGGWIGKHEDPGEGDTLTVTCLSPSSP